MKKRLLIPVISSLCALFLYSSCKKGEAIENQAPETYTAISAINLSGENRLNSLVTLQWWGTDPDGVVNGYEFSFDQQTWFYTENQDSTFLFSINAGSDTIDIDFWVRAIDADDAIDETPAYLKIPLKNTPPEIEFNDALIPADTVFTVLGLTWKASDLDGDNTIKDIQLKLNDGQWTSINISQTFGSIIPANAKTSGAGSAKVWYDLTTAGPSIDGLLLNQTNNIYIKAIDIAGSESVVDTIQNLYVKGQTHDILVIAANGSNPNEFYKSHLNTAGASYDFIDFVKNDAINQPRVWNPVFAQMLRFYSTVVMYANDVDFLNVQTNAQEIILEYASTAIQDYVDQGGKLWLNSSFPNAFSTGSALFGILPVDSLSTAQGQARLPIDSLSVGEQGYPDLTCSAFISGLDPFYPSIDATVIYTSQLTKNNAWEGPKITGVKRKNGSGNTNFVFMSVELHKLGKDDAAMQSLFDKVLNEEFNW